MNDPTPRRRPSVGAQITTGIVVGLIACALLIPLGIFLARLAIGGGC